MLLKHVVMQRIIDLQFVDEFARNEVYCLIALRSAVLLPTPLRPLARKEGESESRVTEQASGLEVTFSQFTRPPSPCSFLAHPLS